MATPHVERSDVVHAVNATNVLNPAPEVMLAEATGTLPQVARETIATTLAKAALILASAIRSMLRRTPIRNEDRCTVD